MSRVPQDSSRLAGSAASGEARRGLLVYVWRNMYPGWPNPNHSSSPCSFSFSMNSGASSMIRVLLSAPLCLHIRLSSRFTSWPDIWIVPFGSSAKTSDFSVDVLEAKWDALDEGEKASTSLIQITRDNGPESSGRRTTFLHRRVQLADAMHKPIQLLYYPPYHSKYNPIERGWGILERHGNGTKLIDAETMLEWAKRMTWKGLHPVVELSHKVYQ